MEALKLHMAFSRNRKCPLVVGTEAGDEVF